MIKQVELKNFKSFALEHPIQLPRFLVLVGNNGAGKTNFCDAFDFARDVLEHGLREALLDERRGGFDNIVRGRKSEREITCQFTFSGTKGLYQRLEYQFSVGLGRRKGQPMILKERLGCIASAMRCARCWYCDLILTCCDNRSQWEVNSGWEAAARGWQQSWTLQSPASWTGWRGGWARETSSQSPFDCSRQSPVKK